MYLKKLIYIALLLAIPILGIAQQWEIDFNDHTYSTRVNDGILAHDGDIIAIGLMASDNNYINPLLLRIKADGSYNERVYYDIPCFNPYSIVKLNNGNYMSWGVSQEQDISTGTGVIIFNDSLDIISIKCFELDSIVSRITGGKAIVDDDGTVVVCGEYEPGSTRKRPFFYRLNEDGGILDCHFVEPSNDYWAFNCYQILKDPHSDGYIVLNKGRNGLCSITFYDRQFSETGYFVPQSNNYNPLYIEFNSEKWLSEDRLLTFGHTYEGRAHGYDLLLADISLDGTTNRYVNILNNPDTTYHCRNKCMAVVNDTTMYGLFYLYHKFKGSGTNAGACLFNKNMELLGVRRFINETYHDIFPSSVVALPDGGCVLLCFRYNNYHDEDIFIIKMSREDFNPIPCSVSEVPKEQLETTVFPNPTRGELNINISKIPQNTENRVSITDVNGITRMCRIIQGSGNLLTIDASSLESGVYLYSIYNSEKEFVKGKFIKE